MDYILYPVYFDLIYFFIIYFGNWDHMQTSFDFSLPLLSRSLPAEPGKQPAVLNNGTGAAAFKRSSFIPILSPWPT